MGYIWLFLSCYLIGNAPVVVSIHRSYLIPSNRKLCNKLPAKCPIDQPLARSCDSTFLIIDEKEDNQPWVYRIFKKKITSKQTIYCFLIWKNTWLRQQGNQYWMEGAYIDPKAHSWYSIERYALEFQSIPDRHCKTCDVVCTCYSELFYLNA